MAFDIDHANTSYQRLRNRWTQLRHNMRGFRDKYYHRHWESEPSETDYQATLPLETLVVDTAFAMITTTEPSLLVNPTRTSDKAANDADASERWHRAVDYEHEMFTGHDPRELALLDALIGGVGCYSETADFPDDWDKDYDSSKRNYPLFCLRHIPPRQFGYRSGRAPGGITHLYSEGRFTLQEIESEWGRSPKRRYDESLDELIPNDPEEERTVVDYWEWRKDKLYHCVFISDPMEFLKSPVEMAEYSRIPYYPVICFETGEEAPEDRYLSFLFKLKDVPHLAEIVVSRELAMADLYIDPIMKAKSANGTPLEIDKAPGSIIDMGPDDDVTYLQPTGAPPDLPRVRELLMNIAYLVGFSPNVYSEGTGDSALAKVADVEQAMFKIARPVRSYKNALQAQYWHRAHLANAFSPRVAIPASGENSHGTPYSVSVSGVTLYRNCNVHVRLRPGLYSRLLADINVATQALNAKLWGPRRAMDFVGVEDRETEMREIRTHLLDNLPNVIEAEGQLYAKDLMDELTALQQEANPEAQPAAPGIGAPPEELGVEPTTLQPAVQGMQNSLNTAGGDLSAGAVANPSTPASLQEFRQRAMDRGGRPAGAPTTQVR